jgi:hypothetical protein
MKISEKKAKVRKTLRSRVEFGNGGDMKKLIMLILVSSITIVGCATPPGQLTKDDFHWTTVQSELNYQEAYLRMDKGFNSEGLFVTEGNIYSDLGKGMIDVYMKTPLTPRSPYVSARVYVTRIPENKSLVEIGSNNSFGKNDKARQKWAQYLTIDNKTENK